MKRKPKVKLEITKKSDQKLLDLMKIHYSKPKGFVGRSICYAVFYEDIYYGYIVGGSSTMHLAGRDSFFSLTEDNKLKTLNKIVNNIFYHIEKQNNKYPTRNFTTKVLKAFRYEIVNDWKEKYNDEVIGFESLVEIPRKGDLYLKDKWILVGQTKGYTCKRTKGKGTDNWSGKRIWDTKNLRPKKVFCKWNEL